MPHVLPTLNVVGDAGIEPAIFCSQSRRHTACLITEGDARQLLEIRAGKEPDDTVVDPRIVPVTLSGYSTWVFSSGFLCRILHFH